MARHPLDVLLEFFGCCSDLMESLIVRIGPCPCGRPHPRAWKLALAIPWGYRIGWSQWYPPPNYLIGERFGPYRLQRERLL
jgi:hypothetical protein